MNRRSMGGRIYQEQTFRPKNISLKNPEQRIIQYPVKGDTSFEPTQSGRKHYLSPKHSAIHSIIFNQNYENLMQEKKDLINHLSKNTIRGERFDEKRGKKNIQELNSYLNKFITEDKRNNTNNNNSSLPPYQNFNSYTSLGSYDKVRKGHLYRQGSMNQVLKPYQWDQADQNLPKDSLNSSRLDSAKSKQSKNLSVINSPILNRDLRQINPNYLNSFF